MAGFAWVTLATNDSYSLGALVLANSLRQLGTPHQLAVLVTPGVTNAMREQLRSIFNLIVEVNILDSKDEANLRLLKRPELGVTFTKLHCWRLTQYEKCVFLDADTLVLQNADELFEREELSAAPDVGWPDCFNSGVFVYRPSNETYENLVKFALEKGSFDGGDQGLLNSYFSDWAHKDISKHLPFIYNMCSTACYSYLPAFKEFGSNVKIVHFIGPAKPWLQYFDTESRQVQPSSELQHLRPVLQRWWDIFFSFIQPNLSNEMARSKSPAVHNPHSYPQPFYTSFPSAIVTYEQNANFDYTITVNESGPSNDYKNVWDPWDEYEQNTEQIEHNSSQLVAEPITISGLPESHNTNAHSVVADVATFEQPNMTNIPNLSPPPPPPPPIQYTIPTYHPPSEPQTKTTYVDVVETKSTTPPPLPLPPQPPLEIIYFPVENQYSFINNHPIEVPVKPPKHVPSNHQNHAQPHEFEPPCTVANESTLHPNDTGSHDHKEDAGLAAAFSQLKLGEPRSPGQLALEDHLRRQGWEVGNIDYLGRDSFENIWKKICETIDPVTKPKEPTPPPVTKTPEVPPAVVTQKEPEPVTKPSPESQTQEQKEVQSATAQKEITDTPPAAAPAEVSAATAPLEAQPTAAPAVITPTAAPAEVPPTATPAEVPIAVAPSVVPPVETTAVVPPTAAPAEVPLAAAPSVVPPVEAPAVVPPTAAPAEVPLSAAPSAVPPVEVTAAVPPAAAPAEVPLAAAPSVVPAVEAPAVVPSAVAPAEVPSAAAPPEVPPAATVPAEVPPVTAPVEVLPAVAPAEVPSTVAPVDVPLVAVSPEVPPTESPAASAPASVEIPPTVPTEVSEVPPIAAPTAVPSAGTQSLAVTVQSQTTVTPPEAVSVAATVPAEPQSTTLPAESVATPPAEAKVTAPPPQATQVETSSAQQPASPAAEATAAPVVAQETAKSQQKVKGESTKKTEPKSTATPSEAAGPTPPPRKGGSSPKKTKAKK